MSLRAASLLAAVLSTGAADAATLTLRFAGLQAEGAVLVALFDTEKGFRADRPIASARAEPGDGAALVTFRDLAAGRYAVKAFQDGDGNGALTTNALGIPREPYAFSNNARGRFGPPGWSKAAFTLRAGETAQTISMD